MAATTVTNWFGDMSSQPAVVVEAESTEDVVSILRDSNRYPSPVRAIGSFHSTAACGVADGGTLIRMSKMNRILSTGPTRSRCKRAPSTSTSRRIREARTCSFTSTPRSAASRWGARHAAAPRTRPCRASTGRWELHHAGSKWCCHRAKCWKSSDEQPEDMQQLRSYLRDVRDCLRGDISGSRRCSRWRCSTRRSRGGIRGSPAGIVDARAIR